MRSYEEVADVMGFTTASAKRYVSAGMRDVKCVMVVDTRKAQEELAQELAREEPDLSAFIIGRAILRGMDYAIQNNDMQVLRYLVNIAQETEKDANEREAKRQDGGA